MDCVMNAAKTTSLMQCVTLKYCVKCAEVLLPDTHYPFKRAVSTGPFKRGLF